jgi:hypothetical protein
MEVSQGSGERRDQKIEATDQIAITPTTIKGGGRAGWGETRAKLLNNRRR